MSKRSPRFQFTDEERAAPELQKAIQKAEKKADKLDKAEAKIPKKTVKRAERVVDAHGRVTTRLHFEKVEKKKPPSKLSHAVTAAPANTVLSAAHSKLRETEEDNVGTESAHKLEQTAEGSVRTLSAVHRSHKLKPYRNAARAEVKSDKANLSALNQQAQRQNPQFSSNPYSRWQQKRTIKKEYMAAKKSGPSTIKAGQATAKAAKKAAEDTKKSAEFVKKNWKGILIVLALLLIVALTFSCLLLAVLCVASFSITAFAPGGDETETTPDVETTTETEVDFEIPYSYTIDENGNLIITINGVADPAESTTIGTVTTNGGRLNLRTGAGMSYEIIDQLRNGEEVTVIGSEGDWYEVVFEKKGYVHSSYLEVIEKAEQNSEIDSAMLKYLMQMMFQGFENTDSETDENGKPPFAFTPDGNLTLIDDFLQIEVPATEETEQVEKQFITVQSKNGNTFYIIIDRNGETENVYFLNLVDEGDLMAESEDDDA